MFWRGGEREVVAVGRGMPAALYDVEVRRKNVDPCDVPEAFTKQLKNPPPPPQNRRKTPTNPPQTHRKNKIVDKSI